MIATSQITIIDLNDAFIAGDPPANPEVGQLWIKTIADKPDELYVWTGTGWAPQHLALASLDPEQNQKVEDAKTDLDNMASDSVITVVERNNVKDNVAKICGKVLNDAETMPSISTIDSSVKKGEVYQLRKEALALEIPTSDAAYAAFESKYNVLRSYLNGLSPLPWNVALDSIITVDKVVWRTRWFDYYDAYNNLRKIITDKISQENTSLKTRVTENESSISETASQVAVSVKQEVYNADLDAIDKLIESADSKAATAASDAAAAQTAANNAASAASAAQATANTAETKANTANNLLSDLSDDNKITPSEKQETQKEWDIIKGEKPTIVAQATIYSIGTEKTTYETKYNELNTYITPLLSNLTITSNIVGTDFRTKFKAYYDAKTTLLKKISDLAKSKADAAQSTANTAQTNAQNAASAASQAQSDANDLKERVSTAEGTLTVQSGLISAKVSNTEFADGIQATKDYVVSRSENLVSNGTGLMGDNTNFSEFTFDPAQVYSGGGSFFTNSQNSTKMNDELIPINPAQTFRFSLMAKSKTGLGHNYFGITPFDIDKNTITPYNYFAGANPVVELAQDLKEGDTVVHLTSVEGFVDTQATTNHLHSMLLWGYTNSYGYEYPVGTYSQYTFTYGWNQGAIDPVAKTITFKKPFDIRNKKDPDGVFRAGHKVSATSSGGTYKYITASNVKVPTEWTSFSGEIKDIGLGGTEFPPGSAFIKLLFLVNRSSSGGTAGDELWLGNLEFTNVAQEVNAKGYADATIEPVSTRLSTAEQKIESDNITSTVLEHVNFQNALGEKADTEALGDLVTTDNLDAKAKEINESVDDKIKNIDYTTFAKQSDLEQTTEAFTFKFKSAGGVNLLMNSIGFVGTDFWAINGTMNTVQNLELDQLGYGSGFINESGVSGYMEQVINTKGASVYTLSFWMKSSSDASPVGAEIYIDGTKVAFVGKNTGEGATNGYEQFTHTFETEYAEAVIRFTVGSSPEAIFTGIMANVGEEALQWTQAPGEVYNGNVLININGVKVLNSANDGYTVMSPEEFSGYSMVEDDNGNLQMQRVFTLNEDTTEVSKIDVDKEIIMGQVRILNITSPSVNGWAFIPNE